MLKSYSTNNTAYCRKVRAYQTDFPPSWGDININV
jgi:hypothetical protein